MNANRNSCFNAAQQPFCQFPVDPPPVFHCGFSKSSSLSSYPPPKPLHSLSADYLGSYFTEEIDSTITPSSFHSNVSISAISGVGWGWRARRLFWFSKTNPSTSLPIFQSLCSILVSSFSGIFNLPLVTDSTVSAYKPDTHLSQSIDLRSIRVQVMTPNSLLGNTEATSGSFDRSCRVFSYVIDHTLSGRVGETNLGILQPKTIPRTKPQDLSSKDIWKILLGTDTTAHSGSLGDQILDAAAGVAAPAPFWNQMWWWLLSSTPHVFQIYSRWCPLLGITSYRFTVWRAEPRPMR